MLRHRIFNSVVALVGSGGMAFVHVTLVFGLGLNGIPEAHSEVLNVIFVLGLLCLPIAVILAAMLKTRAFRGVLILQMILIVVIYFFGAHLFPKAKDAKQVAYNQKRISWLLEHASHVLPCPEGYQLVLTEPTPATPTNQNAFASRGLFLIPPTSASYPTQLQQSVRGMVMKGPVLPNDVPDPSSCARPNDPTNYQALLDELMRWNDALKPGNP